MSDETETIEVVIPIVDDDTLDDLSADQLRVILHNHAMCIGQLVEIGNSMHETLDRLTQVVTAYTMQYPLDIDKLTSGDDSPIVQKVQVTEVPYVSGAYL